MRQSICPSDGKKLKWLIIPRVGSSVGKQPHRVLAEAWIGATFVEGNLADLFKLKCASSSIRQFQYDGSILQKYLQLCPKGHRQAHPCGPVGDHGNLEAMEVAILEKHGARVRMWPVHVVSRSISGTANILVTYKRQLYSFSPLHRVSQCNRPGTLRRWVLFWNPSYWGEN